ncbi:hypothetical protein FRB99_002627, partial [Tulasnella sp. 403]
VTFYLGNSQPERQAALSRHLQARQLDQTRHPADVLQSHLNSIAGVRIGHIQRWLDTNLARFPPDNPDIVRLRRTFADQSRALRANLELCLLGCAHCHRRCILHRLHEENRCGSLPVAFPPDIRADTYAILEPTFADSLVTYVGDLGVRDDARSLRTTRMEAMSVRRVYINVERQVNSSMDAEALTDVEFGSYHREQLHSTAHGSMVNASWVIEGDENTKVEVDGRKFGAQDSGAAVVCKMVCSEFGRGHPHLSYCPHRGGVCAEPESEHIDKPMSPEPERPKDWVSHRLHWQRLGFEDPAHDDPSVQDDSKKSYCILPVLHKPAVPDRLRDDDRSYISDDGHHFACPNPRKDYHIIFVLDRSGSMQQQDQMPSGSHGVSGLIRSANNNRFGSVLEVLYDFWTSRTQGAGTNARRRDAYSVITFNDTSKVDISNDVNSTPDKLLVKLVYVAPDSGTNFDAALSSAQRVMESSSSQRMLPVIILLSDGEADLNEQVMLRLCNRAVKLGHPLAFYAVAFGTTSDWSSLHRMVEIAQDVAGGEAPCEFKRAEDS